MENNTTNTLAKLEVSKQEKLDILKGLLGVSNLVPTEAIESCGGIVAYSDTTYVRS